MSVRGVMRGLMGAGLMIACLASGDPASRSAHAAQASSTAPSVSVAGAASPHARAAATSAASEDDRQDIRDIHGPVRLPGRFPLVWVAAGALAVAGAAAGLVAYRRRRRPPVPPHQRALRALEEAHRLVGADPRMFSFTVSEIVRTYVEDAFSLRAAHRTTEELLGDLVRDPSAVASHRAELATFLHHCDLAKFAGWSLSPTDMAAMLGSAEAFVRATAPDGAAGRPPVPTALGGEGLTLA